MKKLIVLLFLALASCTVTKEGTRTNVAGAKDEFDVQKLFEKDGCTVYRFEDVGRYRYFTSCTGNTSTEQPHSCGKTQCPVPEEIQTSVRGE